MPMPLIIAHAEEKLLMHLSDIAPDRLHWRAAVLNGSQMQRTHRRMLRLREAHVSVYEIIKEADIAAFFCQNADIVFLFRYNAQQDSWPILQSIVRELLPYLDPGDIDFTTLFTFYNLETGFESLESRVRAMKHEEEQIAQETLQSYEWNPKAFLEAQKKRKLRRTKLAALIEDNYTMRQLAKTVLQPHYGVVLACNGYEGLEMYNNYAPDLVFLDIDIPHINGLQVLQTIMAADAQANVVMFSAHSEPENLQEAMRLGAKGFVTKPFTAEKVLQYARKAMDKAS